ncbi:MAG: GIY-YIG nuclease family protein [Patescibacteria group bacterium]
MYTVYVLKSLNFPKTYTGFTNDLERRLEEHNTGKSTYTKRYAPWEVVYTEEVANRKTARKREKYFKSATGRRHLKKLLEENNK